MITEVAILKIDPAESEKFERTYREVVHILQRQPGYQSDRLIRAIEYPEQYILSPELEQEFDMIWDKMITQRFGFKDYSELRVAIGELRT